MFSMLFGGTAQHYEMLLMGRIVYGCASSLHHTSFEAYAVHQHATLGFPDDWLQQTFSHLTHCMALMAALSGVVGQMASNLYKGEEDSVTVKDVGCPILCCVLFLCTAVFIGVMWEKDTTHAPRFMLSSFVSNISTTLSAVRSNRQMLLLVLVSSLCESSITIFSYYWAPWMATLVQSEEDSQALPYEVIFSSFIVASMLGNYLFQLHSAPTAASPGGGGPGGAFQAILLGSSVSYFLGAVFQTPLLAFAISIVVQLCMGGYWPSIGYFRGKIVLPELRNTTLAIPRVLTLLVTMAILSSIHHSPMMMLASCALLNGAAAYIQITYMDGRSISDVEMEDDDDDADF
eukprot:CAMPEP_0170062026 /NCGR_PEP_ID=MMETSP0019_2-20121128/3397_1 /TAXON_ID=98059 /ORGANISM="Dinobryon sp., Strain UTEXLB2267" /LENGTH=345 /DNA_ID=CAMNT_0010268051 /DNA_START=358 /DNA_END=1395 /DNA_ORIENTATION=+